MGVAVPVVLGQSAAASLHALGATNYLVNGGFENGAQGTTIPGWTTTSTTGNAGSAGVDNVSPFQGNQKLTFYNGSSYQVTVSQTINNLPNGTYLLACYVAGDPNKTNVSITGNTSTLPITITDQGYNFKPFSLAGVPVTGGTLTVGLNLNNTSGYVGWDGCSVTKQ